jgi:hypothetical protein
MPVAMLIDNPNVTQELYDRVREQLGLEGAPAGGIFHAAGPSPEGGWRVVELWDSEDDARRFFSERLGPAFEAAGITAPRPEPQFWPVHSYLVAREAAGDTGVRR